MDVFDNRISWHRCFDFGRGIPERILDSIFDGPANSHAAAAARSGAGAANGAGRTKTERTSRMNITPTTRNSNEFMTCSTPEIAMGGLMPPATQDAACRQHRQDRAPVDVDPCGRGVGDREQELARGKDAEEAGIAPWRSDAWETAADDDANAGRAGSSEARINTMTTSRG